MMQQRKWSSYLFSKFGVESNDKIIIIIFRWKGKTITQSLCTQKTNIKLYFYYHFIDETEECFYFCMQRVEGEGKTFKVSKCIKTWKGKSNFPYIFFFFFSSQRAISSLTPSDSMIYKIETYIRPSCSKLKLLEHFKLWFNGINLDLVS